MLGGLETIVRNVTRILPIVALAGACQPGAKPMFKFAHTNDNGFVSMAQYEKGTKKSGEPRDPADITVLAQDTREPMANALVGFHDTKGDKAELLFIDPGPESGYLPDAVFVEHFSPYTATLDPITEDLRVTVYQEGMGKVGQDPYWEARRTTDSLRMDATQGVGGSGYLGCKEKDEAIPGLSSTIYTFMTKKFPIIGVVSGIDQTVDSLFEIASRKGVGLRADEDKVTHFNYHALVDGSSHPATASLYLATGLEGLEEETGKLCHDGLDNNCNDIIDGDEISCGGTGVSTVVTIVSDPITQDTDLSLTEQDTGLWDTDYTTHSADPECEEDSYANVFCDGFVEPRLDVGTAVDQWDDSHAGGNYQVHPASETLETTLEGDECLTTNELPYDPQSDYSVKFRWKRESSDPEDFAVRVYGRDFTDLDWLGRKTGVAFVHRQGGRFALLCLNPDGSYPDTESYSGTASQDSFANGEIRISPDGTASLYMNGSHAVSVQGEDGACIPAGASENLQASLEVTGSGELEYVRLDRLD